MLRVTKSNFSDRFDPTFAKLTIQSSKNVASKKWLIQWWIQDLPFRGGAMSDAIAFRRKCMRKERIGSRWGTGGGGAGDVHPDALRWY